MCNSLLHNDLYIQIYIYKFYSFTWNEIVTAKSAVAIQTVSIEQVLPFPRKTHASDFISTIHGVWLKRKCFLFAATVGNHHECGLMQFIALHCVLREKYGISAQGLLFSAYVSKVIFWSRRKKPHLMILLTGYEQCTF